MEKENLKTLFSEKTIRNRIASMAENIARTCPGNEHIVIGLLKGSFMFLADLVRELYRRGMRLQIDFIPVSSYGAAKASSGRVQIMGEPHLEIKDRDVLLVDDILDSGKTLHRIIDLLKRKNPSGLQTCVLLDKPSRRTVPLKADFIGFTIPDTFVVGYGLDFNNRYRELPYISELKGTPSSK
jgi:hypoxanthine phosphoribosyltransferase